MSCEDVGRRGMGMVGVGGADLETNRVEQGMERIRPLMKRAVNTVRRRGMLVSVGDGRGEWRLAGRRSGSVRLVSSGLESKFGRISKPPKPVICQLADESLIDSTCVLLDRRSDRARCDVSWSWLACDESLSVVRLGRRIEIERCAESPSPLASRRRLPDRCVNLGPDGRLRNAYCALVVPIDPGSVYAF